jgi:hypothetical protein
MYLDINLKALFVNTTVLIVLTQIVLALYGAGIRRPFGSLRSMAAVLSPRLNYSDRSVLAADVVFAIFIIAMWGVILWTTSVFYAVAFGWFLFAVGDLLANRIDLVRSFFISVGLSVVCVVVAGALIAARFDIS